MQSEPPQPPRRGSPPLLTLLLLCLVIASTQATTGDCTNGCLRCSSNGICFLCDLSNFYTRNGYTCVQKVIPNCNVTLDGVTCYQCSANTFYNATANECQAIAATALRANCQYYNSTQHCVQCNSTSYFADPTTGGCTVLKNPVANCLVYSADGVCTKCAVQYYLSSNKNSCIGVTVVPNCALYSYEVTCTSCQPSYVVQRNLFQLKLISNFNALLSFYSTMLVATSTSQTLNTNYNPVCDSQTTNCLVASDLNNCTTCNSGYFNNNGTCQLNPAEPIPYCVVYQSQTVCITCAQGYYLKNQICVAVTPIPNCVIYDVYADKKCLQCADGYYADTNTCTVRTNTILNCQTPSNATDTCSQCTNSFWLTPDSLSCQASLQFCQTPLFVQQNDVYVANCGKCLNQFYISTTISGGTLSTTCVLPTQLIEGCLEYQQANLCNLCTNGYYLANFNCQKHDTQILSMVNCTSFSTTQLNLCSSCGNSQYLFSLLNYCAPTTTLIANCQTYTNNVCSQCNPGYYIATDPQGVVFCQATNITNCVLTDVATNTCLSCDSLTGTMPNINAVNNQCVAIPMSFTANCQNFTVNIRKNVANCASCFIPYYPLLMNSIYFQFCYPFSEFQNISTGITMDKIKSLGNCQAFDLATQSCLMCDPDSITPAISVQPNGVCVSSCKWGDEVILTFAFASVYPSSYFQCSQVSLIHMFGDSSTNCMRADYDVSAVVTTSDESKVQQFCAACLANYIPIVYNYTSNYYTHFDYLPMAAFNNRLSTTSYFSPLIKRPIFANCKAWTTTFMTNNAIPFDATNVKDSTGASITAYTASSTYFVLNWVNFQNCVTLIGEMQSNGYYAYGCAQCAFQYTGPAITSSQGTTFLYNCKLMTTCDNTVYYAGVGSHDVRAQLYLFVSCHACLDKTTIVTITSVKPWTMPSPITQTLLWKIEVTGNYPSNGCYIPGMIADNVQVFPANCQIQQLVPSQNLQPYTPALSIAPNPACVACAPMYQPTVSSILLPGEVYPFITKCTLITNCASSATFNACDECAAGYVIAANLTAVGNTNGYPCVANTIVGCKIGFENGVCTQCFPSYVLNFYGFCDTIQMKKCSSFGNMTPYLTAYQYLTFNPFPQGCLICQSGTYSVRLPFPVTTCVTTNANAETTLTPNFFIPNCLYYGLNSNYIMTCLSCATGFSPTDTLNNCITRNRILNCLVYTSLTNSTNAYCAQCNNGFYLSNNACFTGEINNCLVYIDRYNCQTCATGFVATLAYFSTYILCFDITQSLKNCQLFDANQAISGYLTCNQCAPNNYLVSFGVPIKTCAGFPIIPNCLTYDVKTTFTRSSFFCLLCSEPYYYSPGVFPSKCYPRTNYPILNCKNYTTTLDNCSSCIVGFYLSVDQLSCVQNPNGIIGCRIYTNITYCQECDGTRNYYVNNGACLTLSQGYAVTNCWAYSSQSICLKCMPQYTYVNGACNKVTIQNCATYQLDNQCTSCAVGYTLISNACYIANIANCLTYATASSCAVCVNGYYANNGICFQPAPIANCVGYAGQSTCQVCATGYILSADATSCTALSTAQRTAVGNDPCAQFSPTRACDFCQFGYYYNSATKSCSACQTPAKTCAVCDYRNPTICLICSAGYFMNRTSQCNPNVNTTVAVKAADNPNTDFYTTSAAILATLTFNFILNGL